MANVASAVPTSEQWPAAGRAARGRSRPPAAPSRPRVLLADDDPDTQFLVRSVLESEGYRVDLAGDGHEALARCLADPPDVLVLDVMMPRLTGFEVLARLRGSVRCMAVPVLVLSARDACSDVATGYRLGADDYLTKPFTVAELRESVQSLVARR
jgi:DNA-binding response OmpR family regulator